MITLKGITHKYQGAKINACTLYKNHFLCNKNTIKTNTSLFTRAEIIMAEPYAKKQKLNIPEFIKEGEAEILVAQKNVFYNPVQEFNRDLSIAVLTIFVKDKLNDIQEKKVSSSTQNDTSCVKENNNGTKQTDGINILDALAATGLRSIRYAKEIPGVKKIVANDIAAKAVESIKQNIKHNNVEDLIEPNHEDATLIMYKNKKFFDVIDLDPYGCPSVFLDSAVQSITEGGLLLVTATDMAVLAGNAPEACYAKYGAVSLKSKSCHEIALRILLQNIASHAGRYGRYIVPLLSISVDFYIRVFVRVFTSQLKCKENINKIGLLYQCTGCESVHFQPLGLKKSNVSYMTPNSIVIDKLCKYCQHRHHVGGPIWLDSLHDQDFVSRLLCSLDEMDLGTIKRIEGVLSMVNEELDLPLYYSLDRLMSIVKCNTPQMKIFRSALLNAGYKVSYSHAHKCSIKTDAPNDVIWDIVRAWEKKQPVKRDRLLQNSPAYIILNTPSTTDVSFTVHPDANPVSRQQRLSRFQMNPTVNWGPGTRSRIMIRTESDDSKKVKNQNKNSKKREKETENNENNAIDNTGEN